MMIVNNFSHAFVTLMYHLGMLDARVKKEIRTVAEPGERGAHPLVFRYRRQVQLFTASNDDIGRSSAQMNTSVLFRNIGNRYSFDEFLNCLSAEYEEPDDESCYLGFQQMLGNDRVDKIIDGCGERFYIRYNEANFQCTCPSNFIECTRSQTERGRRKQHCSPLSDRISCWLRRLPLIPDCDTTTSSSTLSITSTTTTTQTTMLRETDSSGSTSSVTSSKSSFTLPNRLASTTSKDPGLSSVTPTAMLSVVEANGRLIGGVIGGVAVGVVMTSIVVLVCCVCRGYIGNSYAVDKNTPSTTIPKNDDRRALYDESSDTSNTRREHQKYDLPDVVGRLPPYATCAEVTGPAANTSDGEYNHLGDLRKQSVGTGHVYDMLDKSKLSPKQTVINNDYNHTSVKGDVTTENQSPDVSLSSVEVSGVEEPPYSTVQENSEGVARANPKYFILEKQENPPNSPPYTTISVTDE